MVQAGTSVLLQYDPVHQIRLGFPGMVRDHPEKIKTGPVATGLFHMNCFGRADVDTGLAIHTHVFVHFCFLTINGDCGCGTFAHAGFTSGTLIVVNDCYQLVHSVLYVSFIGKKRVTIPAQQNQAKRNRKKPQKMRITFSARAHRSCRRCRASSRQPSGLQQWRRLQRPSGRMHGARARSSRSSLST